MKKETIQIKQRKEDCHHETIFWSNFQTYPVACGFGWTQEIADSNCLKAYLEGKYLLNYIN